jgi:hypothetical protein
MNHLSNAHTRHGQRLRFCAYFLPALSFPKIAPNFFSACFGRGRSGTSVTWSRQASLTNKEQRTRAATSPLLESLGAGRIACLVTQAGDEPGRPLHQGGPTLEKLEAVQNRRAWQRREAYARSRKGSPLREGADDIIGRLMATPRRPVTCLRGRTAACLFRPGYP